MNDISKEEALSLVTLDGMKLRTLPEKFRHDREVVLAAVTQFGGALLYVCDELQDDSDIVLSAVYQDANIFQFLVYDLKKNAALSFIRENRAFVPDIDWPIIKKALIEKPDYFLNPEPYMKALIEGVEYPYLMLAQYALNKDIKVESAIIPAFI